MTATTTNDLLYSDIKRLVAELESACECPSDQSTICLQCRYRKALESVQHDGTSLSRHEELPMTLGEKLAKQQARSKAEQIAEQERIARAEDAEKQRKYEKMERYLKTVREKLVEQILAGKISPRVSTEKNRDITSMLSDSVTNRSFIGSQKPGICYEDSPYHTLWLEFQAWAKENDLVLRANYEHDGVGMESWYGFSLVPAASS